MLARNVGFCLLILCMVNPLFALGEDNHKNKQEDKPEFQDYGTHGHLFEIKEVSLIDEIMEKLETAQKEGRLAQLQAEFTNRVKAKVLRPTPVSGITKVKTARQWTYDPTFTQSETIIDDKGRVIVAAGTTVNALDKLNWGEALIFIDVDDAEQVAWATKQPGKIVLTNGVPLELMDSLKRPVFFDQGGMLCKRFKIEATPALVEQEGRLLRVREVKV